MMLRRYPIIGIIAMLAGCGGSQPPVGGPGSVLQTSAVATHAESRVRPAYSVLHSFGGSGDGDYPNASLINVKGTLYGTTVSAGEGFCEEHGCGAVVAITASGTETVVRSFKGYPHDGATPEAGLVNLKGLLYSTTYRAGSFGVGTVFAISTSGAENVIYSFKGHPDDGAYPEAGLVNVKGMLYGTTVAGGAHGDGTVFAITTSGTETVLHSFGGPGDGSQPYAGLVNVDGTLYGTTSEGGANVNGTVFAITTSGTETVLHSFKGNRHDGARPQASLVNVKGKLYGTTVAGGEHGNGTVFAITTSGAESLIHSFGRPGDGSQPYAELVNVNGRLYGTTVAGGARGFGTVFAITRSGRETVLHNFEGRLTNAATADGESPHAGLVDVEGTLYGTTYQGGTYCTKTSGCGTVFSLTP
jgi:uncharacterized repeat protein (TIGR03803 family)